ncbi:hypothetical protein [Vibrio sp. 99-70-13A1]|uniref:hypothetical protein n=1 Tax=Vibrio sp. 99-70-13A1 TaxID=2607601 RepID=UPI0014939635|nr:hypothetical protein [Vibrio sp. 99-70-13A1]NOH97402.1 hypothetical protein [Vibrio sp. 99-70-13A1]
MNENRIRLVVIFTVDEKTKIPVVCDELGILLSYHFGGVTFADSNGNAVGFWTEQSDQFLDTFTAKPTKESIVIFSLSVMPDKHNEAINVLKKSIKEVTQKFHTCSNHVHVESQNVQAHHFSLNDLNSN